MNQLEKICEESSKVLGNKGVKDESDYSVLKRASKMLSSIEKRTNRKRRWVRDDS